jgi:hypothetical protein
MSTTYHTLEGIQNTLGCIRELLRYFMHLLWAMLQPKATLAARLLASESQLAIHMHRIQDRQELRPRFTANFSAT